MLIRTIVFLTMLMSSSVYAQGFRVSTHVYDPVPEGRPRKAPDSVEQSVAVSHGRVYDLLDSADEVIVVDPSKRKSQF